MTFKNNRAPLLSIIKLYALFHHHMWIQTGVTVRKRLSWFVTSVTLTFDLWPWPFPWTLPWSLVITRWYDDGNIVKTVWQTDGQTKNTIHRAAWSQLKTEQLIKSSAKRQVDGWLNFNGLAKYIQLYCFMAHGAPCQHACRNKHICGAMWYVEQWNRLRFRTSHKYFKYAKEMQLNRILKWS